MLKVIILIIIIIIVGGLGYWIYQATITSESENFNLKTYENKEHGFEMKYPKGWNYYKDEWTMVGMDVISTLSKNVYRRGDVYEEFGKDYALIYITHHKNESRSLDETFKERKEIGKRMIAASRETVIPRELIVTEQVNIGNNKGYRLLLRELAGVQSGIHFSYLLSDKNNDGIIEFWGWFRGETKEKQEEYLNAFNQMLSTFRFLE